MIKEILQKKNILQESPLFDSSYFKKAHCQMEELDTVSTEIRYLSEASLWNCGTSGLFNGSYYEFGSDDLKKLKYPSIFHYISNGYFEARRPSALIDIDHIVYQITGNELPDEQYERHEIKVKALSEFPGIQQILAETKVNPNILFDNEYFLEANELDLPDSVIPINYYYSNCGHNPVSNSVLETTPLFSMKKYLETNEDILAAKVNPLEHLLTYGLRENRLRCFNNMISEVFLKNTADLYQDERYKDHEYFLSKSFHTGQIAGPKWPSRYKKSNIPALTLNPASIEGIKVTIGTVLYENSETELLRLKCSIDKEKEHSGSLFIEDIYLANDTKNIEMYNNIFGSDKVFQSDSGNVGFGSGHNILISRAFENSNYYFGINPDGYLVRDCLQNLVSFSKFHEDCSLIEANTLPVNHPKWHDPILCDTKWVSGVAFFLPKSVWKDVGGFDEDIHMYCEDVDLSWRVKAAGYSLKTCPTANFFHDVTPRFNEVPEESESKSRRKAMLLGAYYLSIKWQAKEEADKYLQALVSERLLLPNQTVDKPKQMIPKAIANRVADFGYDLRFSPSRFW